MKSWNKGGRIGLLKTIGPRKNSFSMSYNTTINTDPLEIYEPSAVVATGHVHLNDGFLNNKLKKTKSIQIKKSTRQANSKRGPTSMFIKQKRSVSRYFLFGLNFEGERLGECSGAFNVQRIFSS